MDPSAFSPNHDRGGALRFRVRKSMGRSRSCRPAAAPQPRSTPRLWVQPLPSDHSLRPIRQSRTDDIALPAAPRITASNSSSVSGPSGLDFSWSTKPAIRGRSAEGSLRVEAVWPLRNSSQSEGCACKLEAECAAHRRGCSERSVTVFPGLSDLHRPHMRLETRAPLAAVFGRHSAPRSAGKWNWNIRVSTARAPNG